jgi:hypothetical protein
LVNFGKQERTAPVFIPANKNFISIIYNYLPGNNGNKGNILSIRLKSYTIFLKNIFITIEGSYVI